MRLALRSLAKSPGFTAVAVLTLALGIGLNTSMFSVLNVLLLHELPYPESDQLVRVFRTTSGAGRNPHSPANFLDYHASNTAFEHFAAFQWTNFNLAEPGQPADRLRVLATSADFFPLLRVQPALGRVFTADEDRPGNNAVVVLSHGTWQSRFAADPQIIGRQVRIDSEPATIIGVMPETFDDHQLWGEIAAWRPLAFSDETRANRGSNYLHLVGRLKADVSLSQAQLELNALATRLTEEHGQANAHAGLQLLSLRDGTIDGFGRNIVWFVMGLAGFVLLIACANVANLQFARNAARAREYAIRTALGSSRARLIRLVLIESVLLSVAGGALGLVGAQWLNSVVDHAVGGAGPAGLEISLDMRVLLFAFVASVLTGLGFGILPAWLTARGDTNAALKQGARGSTGGRSQQRVRQVLIVAEVALALVLLSGASFFMRGLQRSMQRDPGWNPDGLLTAALNLRGPNFATDAQRSAFFDRLHEKLSVLPGVERAALATSVPITGFNVSTTFAVDGQPEPAPGRAPLTASTAVTPGYFETLGIGLMQGRDFTADDREDRPLVVIINEAMARTLWPEENPIGKRIGSVSPFMAVTREVVGVVRNVRPAAALSYAETSFQMYQPLAQNPSFVNLVLRSRIAPEAIAADVRRIVTELDADQAVSQVGTIRSATRRSLTPVTTASLVLAGFALLGVLLAAVGIYGVIAHTVAHRTNEIGVRMALGAQVRDIATLILGGGMRLALLGTALGLIGAFGIGKILRSISPELAATDVSTTAAVTAFLLITALGACWIPARRATRVNPVEALRAD